MTGKEKRLKEKKTSSTTDTTFFSKYWQHLLIGIFSFIIYANAIPNEYAMDDELVTQNHRLTSQGIKGIPEIFTSSYYSDNMGYAYDYRPMVHLTFAVEHQFFGENPHVSHLINVLLYMLLCVCIYVALRQFLPLPDLLVLALVMLFSAHPVHTEVVSSIKNRDELLAFLFAFGSLLYFIRYYRFGKPVWLITATTFFVFALLSKQTVSMMALLIPISLVMFFPFSINRLAIVQLLISVPLFFLMSVTFLDKKLVIISGFIVLPYIILVLRDFTYLHHVKLQVRSLLNSVLQPSASAQKNAESFEWQQLLRPSSFLPALLLGGLLSYALLRHNNQLFFVLLIPVVLLYYFGKPPVKWWAFVVSGIAVLANGYLREIHFELLAGTLFMHWCVFHAVRFNIWFTVPAAALFVAGQLLNTSNEFNAGFVIWAVALYAMRFKFGFVFTLAALVFLMRDVVSDFSTSSFVSVATSGLYLLLYLVPPVLLWLKKDISRFYQPVLILLMAALFFEEGHYSGKVIANPVANTEVNVLPIRTDRPIKYVESPVNLQDPIQVRLGTSFNVLVRYLKLTIIPYPLSYYYGYSYIEPTDFLSPISIFGFFIYLALAVIALMFIRKNAVVSFGMLWYLISIVAFTNMVQTLPGMMGDRYLFGPSLGFCIVLVVSSAYLFKLPNVAKFGQVSALPRTLFIAVLMLYSIMTMARNRDWKNYLTLFENDIEHVDKSSQAHNMLAIQYCKRASLSNEPTQQKKDYEKGLFHFKRALEIYPDFLNVNFDIGRTYLLLQLQDSALPYFKRAAAIDSNFAESFNKIGEILVLQKKPDEAIPYFEYLIRKRPEYYTGYDRLSFLYFNKGEYEKSLAVNRQAVRNIPDSPEPYMNIGRTYRAMNMPDSALYYFRKTNEISPGNAEVQNLINELHGR